MSNSGIDIAVRTLVQEHEEGVAPAVRARDKLPPLADPIPEVEDVSSGTVGAQLSERWAQVSSYRPTPKHVIWLAAAVIVFVWPWMVFFTALLGVCVLVIVYFSAGPDRFGETVSRVFSWYSRRRPEKAEDLRKKVSGGLKILDRALNKLPARWTEGPYLPDLETAEEDISIGLNDPFERLNGDSERA